MATRQRKPVAEAVVAPEVEEPKRKRGPRAGSENARRGGMAVREKDGPEVFGKIGSKGGRTVRERRGPEFYAAIGRLGRQNTPQTPGASPQQRLRRPRRPPAP